MKTDFINQLDTCLETVADTSENIFRCYISWLKDFFFNLGIESEFIDENDIKLFKFHNCPWVDDAETSPMFCMICRVIVLRSFTWTHLNGNVAQIHCLEDRDNICSFQFVINYNE